MTITSLGNMPMVQVGGVYRQGVPMNAALGTVILDASLESAQLIGNIWWADGGNHTLAAAGGTSQIQWRASTVTFAAASTFKVGIAAVDATAAVPARAVNSSDTITMDVSKSYTSITGLTTAAWNTTVLDTGSMDIDHGELVAVCFQLVVRAGSDVITVSTGPANLQNVARPCVTSFLTGAYANANLCPCVVLVANDGTLGYILGGYVASVGGTTQSWNNTGPAEYGNILQFPFPVRIIGASGNISVAGDLEYRLYSAPLSGSPVVERTFAMDANQVAAVSVPEYALFSSYYDLAANTDVAIVARATTSTNISLSYITLNAAAHQTAWSGTGYAVSRAAGTGAFVSQNTGKDRYTIGLLLGGFDNGAGSGGGVARARVQLGI